MMSRSGGGGGGGINNTYETINAAATAIAAAENRNHPHATVVQKRSWGGGCWRLWGCFGSQKHHKRIGHAVLVPEPAAARADAPAAQNPIQTQSIVFPFVAPPSSPASFHQSEPPSATHSPASGLSLTAISAGMYSPSGPASGFVIGPYAHETQLVTPPTFSTFTTEPSTAPFTPPPESVHMTTPSSPEVPFARLLDPNNKNGVDCQRFPLSQYEFQSYLLQPGSPVSHLISPSSGISGSGTSSPLPDGEFFPGRLHFLDIRSDGNSKFSKLEKMAPPEWASQKRSGNTTPEAVAPGTLKLVQVDQDSNAPSLAKVHDFQRNDETVVDHRVSFEITAEIIRCAEKKPVAMPKAVPSSLVNGVCVFVRKDNMMDLANGHQTCCSGEASCSASNRDSTDGEAKQQHQRQRSPTLGSGKEFNFDSVDGVKSERSNEGSDWWANEKILGDEGGDGKSWSFFPVMQPGVS